MKTRLSGCTLCLGISTLIQAGKPVGQEELFLGREEGVGLADDGAQGGAHLHGDEEEDENPGVQTGVGAGVGLGKGGAEEAKAEEGGRNPKAQVEEAHPGEGIGRLGKQPGHGGEADEEDGHQHEQARDEAEHFGEAGLGTAEAAEDVKAGQADERRNDEAGGDFCGRGPPLDAAGKGADDGAIDEAAKDADREHGGDQLAGRGLAQVVHDAARLAEHRFDDAGDAGDGFHFVRQGRWNTGVGVRRIV